MLLFLLFMCCFVVALFYLQISFMFSSYFTTFCNQARRVLPIFQYSQRKTTTKPMAIPFLGEMSAVNDVPFEHLKLIQIL